MVKGGEKHMDIAYVFPVAKNQRQRRLNRTLAVYMALAQPPNVLMKSNDNIHETKRDSGLNWWLQTRERLA